MPYVFEKVRFENVFRPHENVKPAISNSSGLKSVFEKLRFRQGLVWTAGLTAFSYSFDVVRVDVRQRKAREDFSVVYR